MSVEYRHVLNEHCILFSWSILIWERPDFFGAANKGLDSKQCGFHDSVSLKVLDK